MNTFRILTDFVDPHEPNSFYTLYDILGQGLFLIKHEATEIVHGVRTFMATHIEKVVSFEHAIDVYKRRNA